MLLYTVGHTENYRKAFQDCKKESVGMIKLAGGYAFKSVEDAQRLLEELEHADDWSIWQLADTSEDNLQEADDGWWYYLNNDLEIIRELS